MRLPGNEVMVERRGKGLLVLPIEEGEGWGDFWERLVPLKSRVRRHKTRRAERRKPL